jgi:amino acid adenylation domain-containing protein
MKLSEFKLFDDTAERAALAARVAGFNRTGTDYPRDATVHALFAERAAETPEAVAVIFRETRLTYRAAEQAANRLARFLADRGLTAETLVGVMLDRSPDLIIALLGTLKAGGAYLPVNHDLPPERIEYMLRDSAAPVLISERRHAERCRELKARCPDLRCVLYLDDDPPGGTDAAEFGPDALRDYPDAPLPERAGPGTLAYAIYTSGTTGRPKGVMVEHRAILRLVVATRYVTLTAADRILQTGSTAFDASTFEIWGALLNGGGLCLAPRESLLDAAEFRRLVAEHGITTVFLTTGLFNALAAEDGAVFAGLGTLLSGGEKVSVHFFNKVREAYPALRLKHVYGPTENTTFTTCYDVPHGFESDIPIGGPISNTEAYVLDADLELAGIGVQGELCVGGAGLARGYLHDPALTAEKFVPHPYAAGERLYRTGDLARWLDDGNLAFIGREDQQLKIRGYRVEPAEIEQRLLECGGIRQAVVVGRESRDGTRRLVAYFVAEGETDSREFRTRLQGSLPDYMVPAEFVRLDALPLTPNGKVDRKALPEPAQPAASPPETEPASDTQRQLLAIWESVLDRRPIGLDDDFFELGGHSLLATKLMSTVHRKMGVVLPFTAVFTAATVRALAETVLDAARFGVEGIDQPMVLLNGSRDPRRIFAFPPGTADALGYGQLAEGLKPYAFHACNFIEADTRIADYADLIVGSGGSEPYVLFGYSGGGNLAFHVARELENRGRRVGAVVMLDSARFERRFAFPPGEARRVAEQFLEAESVKAYLTSPVLRDKAFRNIERYYAHFSNSEDRHVIDADIHLLLSEDAPDPYRDEQGRIVCSKLGWAEGTRGRFVTHSGSGEHNHMLFPPHLEPNLARLRDIFGPLFPSDPV